MPFFLIVPIWLLCALAGIVLLFIRRFRRIGVYAITVSTTALLVSFGVSTAVLYAGPRLAPSPHPPWYGVALIAAYVAAIIVGGLVGAIAGLVGTRKLFAPA